jgi:rare lipoprotein A
MQHRQRAAYGVVFVVLLIGNSGATQAQDTPASPSDFDKRFYFQRDIPSPPTSESEQVRNPLKELLIPPAEAQTAPSPATPPAVQSQGPETAQTTKNSSLRKQWAQRPIAIGRAAFYEHSGRTASGEKYNPDALTAAHKSLALGTRLRVVNLRTRQSVIVQVTDRSPAKMKFAIDLSRGSARAIGITKRVGTALVAVYKMNNEVTHE